jgi:hypothetical protein
MSLWDYTAQFSDKKAAYTGLAAGAAFSAVVFGSAAVLVEKWREADNSHPYSMQETLDNNPPPQEWAEKYLG